jgi:hypothetical protein
METSEEVFKPPYMSFQTFWNFISELATKPLPPRIDRSLMASKSGTDQFNLNLALTSFGLIDEDSAVQPLLQELVAADEEQRKSILAKMVAASYIEPMRVSGDHGTTKDLEDAFRNSYPSIASADTRRKAITFFLHAARMSDIELSANFPKTRAGSGAPGQSKPRSRPKKRAPINTGSGQPRETPAAGGAEDDIVVNLRTGGTMRLSVDVSPITLRGFDRDFFFKAVDLLDGYEAAAARAYGDTSETADETRPDDGHATEV